jgi:quercetin dioxygenase-like cupin family protein
MRTVRTTTALLAAAAIALGGWFFAYAQEKPAEIIQILPNDVKWVINPALPSGLQTAVLMGNPGKPGPFTVRVKIPADFKIAPHTHPDEWRTVTVLSGTWYFGLGKKFDESKLKAFPPGSFHTEQPGVPHYGTAKGQEVILQVIAMGPSATKYVNPEDAPKKK